MLFFFPPIHRLTTLPLRLPVSLHLCTGLAHGIYGPDHWKHATALTDDNFDSFIQSGLDAGKTVMVRFIASEG